MPICKRCERGGRTRRVARLVFLISPLSMCAQAQNRMPPIPDEEMTEAQKETVEEFRFRFRGESPASHRDSSSSMPRPASARV